MQLLEKQIKLSESTLWPLLKQLYAKEALNAWQGVGTPFYLTSTPFLARQWAETLFEYFREQHEAKLDRSPSGELYPWTILELGAGSGRFAYQFLLRFDQLHHRYFSKRFEAEHPWRYVLLDLSEPLFSFWKSHPSLEPFWKRGKLDYGLCDLSTKEPIELRLSGERLTPGSLKGPSAALGGYLFDTLPAEAYLRVNNEVHPLAWTLQAPLGAIDEGAAKLVATMEYAWELAEDSHHALSQYPGIDQLWDAYRSYLPDGQAFTISCGALSCINRLREICSGGLLFLAGDQGYGDVAGLRDHPVIELGRHGTASCPVNYDAISRLFAFEGQRVLLSQTPSHKFVQMAGFFDQAGVAIATMEKTQELLDRFDNENYWRLFDHFLDVAPKTPSSMYLFLKLGQWDPVNFFHLLEPMEPHWISLSLLEKTRWLQALEKAIEYLFPIAKGDGDVLGRFAEVAVRLGSWEVAAYSWQKALSIDEERADFHFNLGLAFYQMGRREESMIAFYKAQKLDPAFSLDARGLALS